MRGKFQRFLPRLIKSESAVNKGIENKNFYNSYHAGYFSPVRKNTAIIETLKPLQENREKRVSFKGFDIKSTKNALKPIINEIPKELKTKVFDSLKKISKKQYEEYTRIVNDYVELIKTNAEFRKKYGFTDDIADKISIDNLFYRPQKSMVKRFTDNLISPFTAAAKGIKKVFTKSETAEKTKDFEKTMKEFTGFEGLVNSHEIWENGYREISGYQKWSAGSEFLIPDDILLSKIQRRRNKVVDPDKGKYSTTSLMLGNRFISGTVYAFFLGNDAYNTTMRYSNNKSEAKSQQQSRVAQEFSRIGLNMYIQNLLFGTFEMAVNKSLPTALLVSGSTVAFSEILGRKLVGKPIIPSDKETLDRLEKEMAQKKGVLPAIGRLLTNAKKPDSNKQVLYKNPAKANAKTFAVFSKNNPSKSPSFKGYYSVERMFDKQKLKELLSIIKLADEMQYEQIKETIVKSVQNSEILRKLTITSNDKRLSFIKNANPDSMEDINKAFTYLLESIELKEIPLGTKKTFFGQLTKSVIVPFTFVKNLAVSSVKGITNITAKLRGKQTALNTKRMNKMLEDPKFKEAENFKNYFNQRMQLKVWKESPLSNTEKKVRIFEEYMKNLKKNTEEIEGLKNILLWLDKQITGAGIQINKDGKLEAQDLKKVEELLQSCVLKADGAKHVEYDGNKLAQTNINLARAITTIFLVTDAYNLTMQYSGDNKYQANKSAKNRAAQEISRISFSAYILAFVHNLLSKMCNSSLAGAFGLTAMTSVINDSISRKVVGVPLTPKTKAELEEIDEKNAKSKSPIRKALAYSLGKRGAIPNNKNVQNNAQTSGVLNDFFIIPTINNPKKQKALNITPGAPL